MVKLPSTKAITDTTLSDSSSKEVRENNLNLQLRFHELVQEHDNLKVKFSKFGRENENLKVLNQSLQAKLLLCKSRNDKDEPRYPIEQPISYSKDNIEFQSNEKVDVPLEDMSQNFFSQDNLSEKSPEKFINPAITSSPLLSQEISGLITTNTGSFHYNENDTTPPNDVTSQSKKKRMNNSIDDEHDDRHFAKKLNFDDMEDNGTSSRDKDDSKKCTEKSNKTEQNQYESKKEHKSTKTKETSEKNGKENKSNNKTAEENTKNSEEPEFLRKFFGNDDGEKVVMLHLDEDLSIRKDTWDEYMSLPTANRFTVALLRFLYTPKELSQRSVSGSSTWKTPNGVNTRKQ